MSQNIRLMQIMAGAKTGGAENFFMRLAPALARAGLDQLTVIRKNEERRKTFDDANVPVQELKFGGKLDILTPRKLQQLANDFQPDIALAWMNRASAIMPKGDFVKVARLGGYYDLKYYQRCDHLVGNTQDICDYLIKQGWPKDKTWYLPNFVDEERLPPVNRADFDTPQNAPLLLGLGRLHKNKGFDVGIDALAQTPNAYYWIAGNGPEEDTLKAQALKLGVQDRVKFLGWRDDVSALFGAADIFLCSSRHEPLGNMIIEAWAQGTPMAAVASQGPTQLITHGENGLLSPIDDADALAKSVKALIADPTLGVELATSGAEAYQASFTEVKVVEKYLTFFDTILRLK